MVIKELAIDILINTMVRPQPVRIGRTRLMSCSHAQVPTDPWFRVAGLNPSFCQVSLAGGYPGARIGRAPRRTPLTGRAGRYNGHQAGELRGQRPRSQVRTSFDLLCSHPANTGSVSALRAHSPPELHSLYVEKVAYVPFAIQVRSSLW